VRILGVGWALVALIILAQPAQAIEVLLLWDDSPVPAIPRPPEASDLNVHTEALVNALEADGISVTFSRESQFDYDGNTPAPDAFDVVVHLNGNVNPTQYVNDNDFCLKPGAAADLEQYIKNGGGYVGSENNADQINNSFTWIDEFTPIGILPGAPPADGPLTITPVSGQGGHPLFTGLGTSFSITGTFVKGNLRSYPQDFATLLAEDSAGNDAVVVRELVDGRVVGFHHRGNYAGPNTLAPTLSDANVQQLYINSIRWADQTAPTVSDVAVSGPPATNSSTVSFLVSFSESVTGVDATDFAAVPTGLTVSGVISVTPQNDKEYLVSVSGVSGSGFLGLDVLDDDTILDDSFALTPLGAAFPSSANVVVDTIAPTLQTVATVPDPAVSESTPTLRFTFDEAMKNSVTPTITVTTLSNGPITLGAGTWATSTRYDVALGRALTNLDAGLVTIDVSGAQDFLGNAMVAYSDTPISFVSIGLTALISPSGIVQRSVGDSVTFSVTVQGASGPLDYQWKKEISPSVFANVGADAPSLELTNLTFTDSGAYFCEVSDGLDTTLSAEAVLNVVEALPIAGCLGMCGAVAALALAGVRSTRPRQSI
jgi:uncharacterized membrane protein